MDRYGGGRRMLLRASTMATLAMAPALAACGTGGAGASPGASPSALTDAQILALGKQLAQCVREHGVPGLPDPTVQNGRLILPDGAAANIPDGQGKAAMHACQSIVDKLPASALGDNGDASRAPLSSADLAKLRQFATCMRQQGMTDFPDPGPDGTFDISHTSMATEGKSPRIKNGLSACRQYSVGGMRIVGHGE